MASTDIRILSTRSKTLPPFFPHLFFDGSPPVSPESPHNVELSPLSFKQHLVTQLSLKCNKKRPIEKVSTPTDCKIPLKKLKTPTLRRRIPSKNLILPRSKSSLTYPTPPTSEEKQTPDSNQKHYNWTSRPSSTIKKKTPISNLDQDRFCKTLQPRRLLEWSDRNSDYLTLQNYMSYLRMQKHKQLKYDDKILQNHPDLEPRMRSILFDWLMEVCDCFHLQRSTFYLAQTYIDSYLGAASLHVSKSRLQLLGISALFVAAKIEEIDPPKLRRFSYITDGACTDEEILIQEISLLQILKWRANPVTVYDWLRLYLQTTYFYLVQPETKNTSLSKVEVSNEYIESVSFTPMVFAQMCQMLDLAMLDVYCLKWPAHELAAAILYHFSSQTIAKKASNLNMYNLVECVSWLTPMALTLKDFGLIREPIQYASGTDSPRDYRKVPPGQWYNLQLHESEMLDLLDKSCDIRQADSQDNQEQKTDK